MSEQTSPAPAVADDAVIDAWTPKDQWDPAAIDDVTDEEQALWAMQEQQAMFGETPWQRFKRLAKADPLVPGGLLLTALVLGRGLTTMADRNQARGQWFMRARIAAQALTLAACMWSMHRYNNEARTKNDARMQVYATDGDGVVDGAGDGAGDDNKEKEKPADAAASATTTPTAASPFEREWMPLSRPLPLLAASSSSSSSSSFSVAGLTAWALPSSSSSSVSSPSSFFK